MIKLTRYQWFLCLVSLVLIVACHSTSITSNPASNIFKVATDPAFPPFEFPGEGKELKGFDIDLMNAIGQEAGLEIKFQRLPFDSIISEVQEGRVGAAISGMTITPERQKTVSFSRPYFKAGLAIVVQENNPEINSLNRLINKKIAVQIGTTGATEAQKIRGSKISTFDSAPLALEALAKGTVDAVINDAAMTLYVLSFGNLKNIKVVWPLLTEEYYGIALPQNSENLTKINQSLGQLIKKGIYAKIYKKWFKVEPPILPEIAFSINQKVRFKIDIMNFVC